VKADSCWLEESTSDSLPEGGADLGDRTRVKGLAIDNGCTTLDKVVHGPNDPMCCPSLRKVVRLQIGWRGDC
jgi:hypothetical protein